MIDGQIGKQISIKVWKRVMGFAWSLLKALRKRVCPIYYLNLMDPFLCKRGPSTDLPGITLFHQLLTLTAIGIRKVSFQVKPCPSNQCLHLRFSFWQKRTAGGHSFHLPLTQLGVMLYFHQNYLQTSIFASFFLTFFIIFTIPLY